MKKLLLILGLLSTGLYYSQELSQEVKGMLKYDNINDFSTYVKKEDLNKCFMISEGAPYSLLAISIKLNSKKFFNKLIEEKANVNLVCDEKTPLMFAAKNGNAEFAQTLLKNGADKNLKTSKGYTALDYAKKYNQPALIKILE